MWNLHVPRYRFVIGSYVRVTDQTRGAKQDNSSFNPQLKFPNEHVTEVCYGGTFAVPAYRIMELAKEPSVRKVVMDLEEILLTRNVASSVEEHFIERTWAELFANPLGGKIRLSFWI
jgi:hypothetical protein